MERSTEMTQNEEPEPRTDADRIRSLLDQLEQRDSQIETLEEEKEEFRDAYSLLEERADDGDGWEWRHIRRLEASEKKWDLEDKLLTPKNYGLPVPRLEIRWRDSEDGCGRKADYGLVIRHFLGHINFIPIGSTTQRGGGVPSSWGQDAIDRRLLETPFRDGAHMTHDSVALNLPCYVVNETSEKWRKVEVTADGKEVLR